MIFSPLRYYIAIFSPRPPAWLTTHQLIGLWWWWWWWRCAEGGAAGGQGRLAHVIECIVIVTKIQGNGKGG